MYRIKANKHHYYAGYYSDGYPVFNLYRGKRYSLKDAEDVVAALKLSPEFTLPIEVV